MPSSFYVDDNGFVGGGILRPVFSSTSGIKVATTGASITELDISALTGAAANKSLQNQVVLMVTVQGSNAAYFSLGAASSAPGANTSMVILPPNSTSFFAAYATDASAYHQQITGASTLQIVVMK